MCIRDSHTGHSASAVPARNTSSNDAASRRAEDSVSTSAANSTNPVSPPSAAGDSSISSSNLAVPVCTGSTSMLIPGSWAVTGGVLCSTSRCRTIGERPSASRSGRSTLTSWSNGRS